MSDAVPDSGTFPHSDGLSTETDSINEVYSFLVVYMTNDNYNTHYCAFSTSFRMAMISWMILCLHYIPPPMPPLSELHRINTIMPENARCTDSEVSFFKSFSE